MIVCRRHEGCAGTSYLTSKGGGGGGEYWGKASFVGWFASAAVLVVSKSGCAVQALACVHTRVYRHTCMHKYQNMYIYTRTHAHECLYLFLRTRALTHICILL